MRFATWLVTVALVGAACTSSTNVPPGTTATRAAAAVAGPAHIEPQAPQAPAPPPPALPLGCADTGIYSDLDAEVRVALPARLDRAAITMIVDEPHGTLVLYEHDWPLKAYPMGASGGTTVTLAPGLEVALRDADASELTALVGDRPARRLQRGERLPPGDLDADGLPDPLDVLAGGKKLVANGAVYTQDYFTLPYPGGDAPRDRGSCADVVIRTLRNAGLDLQVAIAEDLARVPAAYPMVTRPNASIDHRRVRTMLPYFQRHLDARGTDPSDAGDPFRPGDVIFMDTIPSRPGPDHVGVISDVRGDSGLPLVINNWTDGHRDAEMDLLGFVPVTARYRLPRRR